MTACARCGAHPADESCWFCYADLCQYCWDTVGHCGHAEAEEANRVPRAATRGTGCVRSRTGSR